MVNIGKMLVIFASQGGAMGREHCLFILTCENVNQTVDLKVI